MVDRVDDLKLDVAELESMMKQAQRAKVREILGLQIRKLQSDISLLLENSAKTATTLAEQPVSVTTTAVRRKTNIITKYGWDQSEKFMKIYVTELNGVQNLPKEQVTSSFTDRSFKLEVADLGGKDHRLQVVSLHESIVVSESFHKVKTDMVVIMLKKASTGKTWPYVIVKAEDKKKTAPKKPAETEEKDPGAGLMDMLKTMYDDGDDEMKKTISKAWSESRNKSSPDLAM